MSFLAAKFCAANQWVKMKCLRANMQQARQFLISNSTSFSGAKALHFDRSRGTFAVHVGLFDY